MKTHLSLLPSRYLVLGLLALAGLRPAMAQNSFPTVTIYAPDPHASESGPETGTFTVRRTGPTNFPLAVFYQLSGSASNGVDYENLGISVQIPAGSSNASFTVKPIDDSLVEGDETVVAQITGSPLDCAICGYNIGVPSNAVVVIADNDTSPTTNHPPQVRLVAPTSGAVFIAPPNITLIASAQDLDGFLTIQTVEFFEGTNSLGIRTNFPTLNPIGPFFLSWNNVPPGNYTLTAKATDSSGASTVSDPVYITVFGGVNIYATDPYASEMASAPNIDPPTDQAIFTVRRSGEMNTGIVLYYEISGNASNGIDYERLPGQVTIPAGASSAQIVVKPIDDPLVEGTETVVLTLLAPCPQCLFSNPMCEVPQGTNCYPIGPDNRAVAYIHDNDTNPTEQAVVNIFATDDTGREIPVVPPWLGIAQVFDPAVFTVTRTGPTNFPITVFYSIGGTASNGVDYVLDPATGADQNLHASVTIPAGASSVDIRVYVIDDFFVEGTETVELTVQPLSCIQIFPPPPDCYLVGPSNHAVAKILDNDLTPPPVVTIVATDPNASESGPDNGTFTVSRTGDTSNALPVFYEIGGSAQMGVDYLAFTNMEPFYHWFGLTNVVIPAGASSVDITVTPIDDSLAEGSETVALQLQPQRWAPYIVGVPSHAVVTIADNDLVGTNAPPEVKILTPSDGATFVGPTNILLGANAFDRDGSVTQVEFFAGNHSLGLAIGPLRTPFGMWLLTWSNVPPGHYTLTAQATDNLGAVGISTPVSITVVPNSPPEVKMVTPADGATFVGSTNILLGANAFDRDGSVTRVEFFAGNHSLGLAIGPLRTPFGMWLLTWSNVPPGHYTLTAQATDNLGAVAISTPVSITVVTNSPQPPMPTNRPPVVNIVARDPFASEGTNFWFRDWDANRWSIDIWNPWHVNVGGTNTATFVVRRQSATNQDLTVNYGIGGTASNGVDYVALPGSVKIPAGKRSAQIVVRPIDDTLVEGLETVILTLRPSPDYIIGFASHASAIITDNDSLRPPCVLLPDNQFHLCLPATNGFCFRVEASADLLHWNSLCTNVVTDGALHFVDPDSPPMNARFYRAEPEPGLPPDD